MYYVSKYRIIFKQKDISNENIWKRICIFTCFRTEQMHYEKFHKLKIMWLKINQNETIRISREKN